MVVFKIGIAAKKQPKEMKAPSFKFQIISRLPFDEEEIEYEDVKKAAYQGGIILAVVTGRKPKKKAAMPKHNVVMTVLVAGPLNIFTMNQGFLRKARPIMFEKITSIFSAMEDNLNYPTPSPLISVIQSEIDLYNTAKTKKDTVTANQHFVNIQYMMKQLGVYVANTCGNDLAIFLSSGMTPNSTSASPSKEMGKVVIRGGKDTLHSGEVKLELEEMDGAQLYEIQYQLNTVPLGPMIGGGSFTVVRPVVKGCPLSPCLFYARASSPKGRGDWSNPFPYTPR